MYGKRNKIFAIRIMKFVFPAYQQVIFVLSKGCNLVLIIAKAKIIRFVYKIVLLSYKSVLAGGG
jgi:hypothetical protein